MGAIRSFGLTLTDFVRQNFGTSPTARELRLKIGIGSAGHEWMRDRHGLDPEAPYPQRAGSCSSSPAKLELADFGQHLTARSYAVSLR
jgi:hypothetical protein